MTTDDYRLSLALANEAGQHSLWPAAAQVPAGWQVVHGPAARSECLERIAELWPDIRPKRTAASPPGYGGVPGLVSTQAERRPDAIAVVHGSDSLSFRGLDELSNGYAHWLIGAGLGGEIVPVLMSRTVELYALLLGILKAGSAYCFIDPEDPPARQLELIGTCGSGVLLIDTSTEPPNSQSLGLRVVPSRDAELERSAPATTLSPDTPAYVCFTSGTSGEPRGVLVPHRAITRLVGSPSWISIGPEDVVLQAAPISFDASTFEIWSALSQGCRLVAYPAGRVELAELSEVLTTQAISVLWLSAGLFHRMAESHIQAFARLRILVAGGDVVSPEHVTAVLDEHPGLVFVNGYGPTENTTFTACWSTCTPPGTDPLPIGRPVDGTGVEVLDDDLKAVPVGDVGELWTDGEGLALGYLGSPAATAERFVAHPRGSGPGARMYRTGDRAAVGTDGALVFHGRVDGQVKINGFRVDTAAVELAVQRHPLVAQAAVVSQVSDNGGARLIAYVVLGDESDGARVAGRAATVPGEIRRWLSTRLPRYCVPWSVRVLPELPLNLNGKVDRGALPAARRAPRNVWNDYILPGDELQALLADVWGDVLDVEPVGADDDFFDLGGHSLLAADLIGRLQQEHDITLPARVLYTEPTIAAVAEALKSGSTGRRKVG